MDMELGIWNTGEGHVCRRHRSNPRLLGWAGLTHAINNLKNHLSYIT